jgi:hypothetical protein
MTNLTGLSAQDDEEKRDESDQDVHNRDNSIRRSRREAARA